MTFEIEPGVQTYVFLSCVALSRDKKAVFIAGGGGGAPFALLQHNFQ